MLHLLAAFGGVVVLAALSLGLAMKEWSYDLEEKIEERRQRIRKRERQRKAEIPTTETVESEGKKSRSGCLTALAFIAGIVVTIISLSMCVSHLVIPF